MDYKLSVTELVEAVNLTLDSLYDVRVEGEVDEFKIIHGKWVVFSLKDKESSVNCFMPVWQYKTQVEDGMMVQVAGQPRLRNKGFFSFVLTDIQPAGEGALRRAFLLLQKKLEAEGLFDIERKRSLPRWPQHIALITSKDAAAYSDFLKVLKARQGGLTVSFIHTQVQGDNSPSQIANAINTANTELKQLDAIVLTRGGGSLEDLQAFNDERVVRALAASRTPVVVGVGHERDVTLAEMAADVRASTPSNAAELLIISRQEAMLAITGLTQKLILAVNNTMQNNKTEIFRSVNELHARISSTMSQVNRQIDRLKNISSRFTQTTFQSKQSVADKKNILSKHMSRIIADSSFQTRSMRRVLISLSPKKTLERGYSITRLKNGSLLKKKSQVQTGDNIVTEVSDGAINSEVT